MPATLLEPSYGATKVVPDPKSDASVASGAGGVGREPVATGLLPVQSIPAGSTATATASVALDCGVVTANGVCSVTTPTGTYTTGAVTFQGSLDGTNWYTIGAALTLSSNATVTIPGTAANPAIGRYFRAIISTAVSGAGASVGVMVGAA
jgi:hypothetical protein